MLTRRGLIVLSAVAVIALGALVRPGGEAPVPPHLRTDAWRWTLLMPPGDDVPTRQAPHALVTTPAWSCHPQVVLWGLEVLGLRLEGVEHTNADDGNADWLADPVTGRYHARLVRRGRGKTLTVELSSGRADAVEDFVLEAVREGPGADAWDRARFTLPFSQAVDVLTRHILDEGCRVPVGVALRRGEDWTDGRRRFEQRPRPDGGRVLRLVQDG